MIIRCFILEMLITIIIIPLVIVILGETWLLDLILSCIRTIYNIKSQIILRHCSLLQYVEYVIISINFSNIGMIIILFGSVNCFFLTIIISLKSQVNMVKWQFRYILSTSTRLKVVHIKRFITFKNVRSFKTF